jgi:hypothetical protein
MLAIGAGSGTKLIPLSLIALALALRRREMASLLDSI